MGAISIILVLLLPLNTLIQPILATSSGSYFEEQCSLVSLAGMVESMATICDVDLKTTHTYTVTLETTVVKSVEKVDTTTSLINLTNTSVTVATVTATSNVTQFSHVTSTETIVKNISSSTTVITTSDSVVLESTSAAAISTTATTTDITSFDILTSTPAARKRRDLSTAVHFTPTVNIILTSSSSGSESSSLGMLSQLMRSVIFTTAIPPVISSKVSNSNVVTTSEVGNFMGLNYTAYSTSTEFSMALASFCSCLEKATEVTETQYSTVTLTTTGLNQSTSTKVFTSTHTKDVVATSNYTSQILITNTLVQTSSATITAYSSIISTYMSTELSTTTSVSTSAYITSTTTEILTSVLTTSTINCVTDAVGNPSFTNLDTWTIDAAYALTTKTYDCGAQSTCLLVEQYPGDKVSIYQTVELFENQNYGFSFGYNLYTSIGTLECYVGDETWTPTISGNFALQTFTTTFMPTAQTNVIGCNIVQVTIMTLCFITEINIACALD